MTILVINSGSSSIKYGLYERREEVELERGAFDGLHSPVETASEQVRALRQLFESVHRKHPLSGIGHRVVHGGAMFRTSVLLNEEILEVIHALNPLAPLHNPACVRGIQIALEMAPQVPQVAVFDTAFFHNLPEYAWRYALPKGLADQHQIRRYGFHGISHGFVASVAAEHLGRPLKDLRLITLHLGNGASAAAIAQGRCIDTSMGMTPLEGLVMGSRCGDLDPSILTYLQRQAELSAAEVEGLLNRESGLRGLCGDADMRRIRHRAEVGEADARLAIELYGHRLRKYIGAYVAILGGLDALVFAGGIGEHDAALRAEVCDPLSILGIQLDPARNRMGETIISPLDAPTAVLVIPTNEELAIARETRRCLAHGSEQAE
jgi:acetate kinase